MGLGSWGKRKAVGYAARRAEKELPMLTRWIAWLTDPAHTGRKRNVAIGAGCISGALRGLGNVLTPMCVAGLEAGRLCSADLQGWALWVDQANLFIQNVVVPGVDVFAIAMGAWGYISGKRKSEARKDYVSPRT